MIWIIIILALVFAAITFLDVSIDITSEYGVIYYSYNHHRYTITLWGSNY